MSTAKAASQQQTAINIVKIIILAHIILSSIVKLLDLSNTYPCDAGHTRKEMPYGQTQTFNLR